MSNHSLLSKIQPVRPFVFICDVLVLLAALAFSASAQSPPPTVPGGPPPGSPERLPEDISREEMWPAPTAEDWNRPCLIKWQRTWEDAVAVSRETGKPILVCVNMDGEIASEHYAGIRYRDPEIAKLYEPYVCVIASVYRHNPRDYDEEGNRIPCPRFGTVTCGEHIAIEPILYKDYFEGQRVAPRHIAVETDGTETYDVFYAWDTASVFNTLRDDIERRPDIPLTVVRSDRPIVERVASRDIADRIAVESAYKEGDRDLQRALLEAAIEHPETAQIDLLRQAVFGYDIELSRMARVALAKSESESAYKLINEALRVPMERSEREGLIGALERIGETSPRARMLAVVHQGLMARSKVIDAEGWTSALEQQPGLEESAVLESQAYEKILENQAEVFASQDFEAHLKLAEAFLAGAFEQREAEPKYAEYLFRDAHRTALRAEELGAAGWRLNAAIALSDYHLGKMESAYERAEAAVSGLTPGDPGWMVPAALNLFAEARWKSIARAVQDLRDWDAWSRAFQSTGDWLTDVHSAYSVLEHHPLAGAEPFAAHYDFLNLLEATGQAARVLDMGIARFPDSWDLHYRLRGRIHRDKGVEGLQAVYREMSSKENASPYMEWFAGYASMVAAEFQRRRNQNEEALAAYDEAAAHFERWVEAFPEERESADHYIALALAGRARMAFESEDFPAALDLLIRCFERKPEAAATQDGLNISPVDTAKMLLARLKEQENTELASRLQDALDSLDPEMLLLPAYEGAGPPDRGFRDRDPEQRRRPRR